MYCATKWDEDGAVSERAILNWPLVVKFVDSYRCSYNLNLSLHFNGLNHAMFYLNKHGAEWWCSFFTVQIWSQYKKFKELYYISEH